jgi:GAF domain-containing protein
MASTDVDGEQRYRQAIERLGRVLVDAPTLRTTLEELLAVTALAGPDIAALTVTAVGEDGSLTSAASTDDDAREVDEHEYAIVEGPCIDALGSGEEQLLRDTTTDGRWPRFAAAATEHGFRCVAGIPLFAPDGTTIGALNAFGNEPDSLLERDLAMLRRVVPPTSAVLANARAFRRSSSLRDALEGALEERGLINRAVGVLLGRHGGSGDEALDRLRRAAEDEDTTLLDVAERVVAGELDLRS